MNSITIAKTNSENQVFINLVKELDTELAERDGEEHPFYAQFNKIVAIKNVLIAHYNDVPMGCGSIKEYDPKTVEIKRMYVVPESRERGVATKILSELENWAIQLGYERCILETGMKQPEAIGLYKKNGYARIPNYTPYAHMESSLCFGKELSS